MEKVLKVLELIGLDKAEIAKLQAEDVTAETITEIADGIRAKQRELVKNDPDIISQITKRIEGQIKDVIESKLKKVFELSSEETKDLKIEGIIELAKTKAEKTPVKEAQEVQAENMALKTKISELEASIPEIETKHKTEAETLIKKYKIGSKVEEHLSDLYSKQLLMGKPTMWKKMIEDHLWGNYKVDVGDDGIDILTKDGLKVQNKEKTSIIGVQDVIKNFLDENDGLKKSNAGAEPPKTPPPPPEKKISPQISRGLQAAEANLERMSKKS